MGWNPTCGAEDECWTQGLCVAFSLSLFADLSNKKRRESRATSRGPRPFISTRLAFPSRRVDIGQRTTLGLPGSEHLRDTLDVSNCLLRIGARSGPKKPARWASSPAETWTSQPWRLGCWETLSLSQRASSPLGYGLPCQRHISARWLTDG